MKNLLLSILFSALSFAVVAQNTDIDNRLLAKYSHEELSTLQVENPTEFKFLTYCLDHAWYLNPLPKEKMKKNDGRIGTISIKDIENINFCALNIEIIKDDYQFFAIEGTEQMLVVKSRDHINKEINK